MLVVGPSGSGKSTLARALAGLLPSEFPGEWQGSLRVGDVDVATAEAGPDGSEQRLITTADLGAGILLQDPASQLVMERVGDDVAFALENAAWPPEAMRTRVPEALGEVGLAGFEARRSNRLSGGEQQRVALAGVLAPWPGVLILDEPTAHLDPAGAEGVVRILAALRQRRASTIVLIEHRASLAWPLADLVLALDDDGRPIDVGPPAEVLARSGSKLEAAGIWLPGPAAVAARRSGGRPRERGALDDHGADLVLPERGTIPVLTLRQVRFGFDAARPVLRDIDVAVMPGDRIALVGPNGSGKTTLLRLALGLLRPTAGAIRLGGRDPSRMPPVQIARLAGYVVQEPELGFLGDTVRDEIELGLEPEQVRYAHDLAERLRLPLGSFGDRSPYRLSGGEQRRLSLVTGLARRPLLLALDEPTFGQDRRGHDALVAALDELVEQGSAVLAATHDERFVQDATERRIELAEGWIVGIDAVEGSGAAAAKVAPTAAAVGRAPGARAAKVRSQAAARPRARRGPRT
jgi:energy-coupling factor transport system ATP-binding protein